MKYIFYVFVAVLTLVAVIFAVSNRHEIDVYFWPFPVNAKGALYIWIMATFVVGFFSGWFAAWLRSLAARHRDRVLARRAEPLEKEVTELRQRLDAAEAKPSPEAAAPVPSERRLTTASQ